MAAQSALLSSFSNDRYFLLIYLPANVHQAWVDSYESAQFHLHQIAAVVKRTDPYDPDHFARHQQFSELQSALNAYIQSK